MVQTKNLTHTVRTLVKEQTCVMYTQNYIHYSNKFISINMLFENSIWKLPSLDIYNKTTKYIFLIFAVDKHKQKSEIKYLPSFPTQCISFACVIYIVIVCTGINCWPWIISLPLYLLGFACFLDMSRIITTTNTYKGNNRISFPCSAQSMEPSLVIPIDSCEQTFVQISKTQSPKI